MLSPCSNRLPGTRQRGFTLVEFVAMTLVLAVLSAVVVGALGHIRPSLTAETALLRANLRYAQARAMADSGAAWSVEVTTVGYALHRDGILAPTFWPGESSATHAFADATMRVTAGTGTIVFDAWGNPGAADRAITLTDGDQTTTVTLVGVTGFVR